MKNPNIRRAAKSPNLLADSAMNNEFYAIGDRTFIFEKTNGETNLKTKTVIIALAALSGEKKRVKRQLPQHNLDMEVMVASPLNIYKANLKFTTQSRPIFFNFMTNVWARLLGNPSFPAPPVTSVVYAAEKILYDNAKAAKNTVGADQHLANLIYMAKQNAVYIANSCGNSLDTFNTSGYVANKTTRAPAQRMAKVVVRGCRDTRRSGEAMITMAAVPGAQYYQGCWCLASDVARVMHNVKGSKGIKMLFSGLPKGADVLLFAWATGPLDEGDLSNAFPWMAR
ncbi:MAG: hypothetical protein WCL14_03230 [Bacteroidota bacterium]